MVNKVHSAKITVILYTNKMRSELWQGFIIDNVYNLNETFAVAEGWLAVARYRMICLVLKIWVYNAKIHIKYHIVPQTYSFMCLDLASLKRCVFRDPLKFTLLLSPLTLSGRLFQSLMAFIKKDPSSLPLMGGCIKL